MHPITIGTKINGTRLTVDSEPDHHISPGGKKKIRYWFKCDCGGRKRIIWCNINSPTMSCGCRRSETSKEISAKIRLQKRICRVCSASENNKEFPTRRNSGNICLECLRKVDRHRYSRIKDVERIERSKENFFKHLLKCIARRRKWISTLELKDILDLWDTQNGICALTGLEMELKLGKPNTVSIDRIDSNLDYDKNNCQLLCYSVNIGKMNFSNEIFKEFLKELKAT